MTTVPSNLVPTRISQLTEYDGLSQDGYLPYVLNGVTYKVRFGNIASVGAVPSSRTITGGGGLTGGGDLTTDRVISIAAGGVGYSQLATSGVTSGTYGSSSEIPVLTVDDKGRVTVATSTAISLTRICSDKPLNHRWRWPNRWRHTRRRSHHFAFSFRCPSPVGRRTLCRYKFGCCA
jgi:hypothetical protein